MADFVRNTFIDAQTTVTSLGAAFAGVAADLASDAIIVRVAGTTRAPGLGQVGLNFIVRALVSSVAYSAAAAVMPETSQNFFFGVLFFASNPGLVRDGRDIASIVLKSTASFLNTGSPAVIPRMGVGAPGGDIPGMGAPSSYGKPACSSC